MREQFTYWGTTLSVLLKAPQRPQPATIGSSNIVIQLRRFTVHFGELGFRIETFHVRNPARHEKEHHFLRFWFEVGTRAGFRRKQCRKRSVAESARSHLQCLAARDGCFRTGAKCHWKYKNSFEFRRVCAKCFQTDKPSSPPGPIPVNF